MENVCMDEGALNGPAQWMHVQNAYSEEELFRICISWDILPIPVVQYNLCIKICVNELKSHTKIAAVGL